MLESTQGRFGLSDAPESDRSGVAAEMNELITDWLARQMALTMHLADESRDKNGEICCCICGTGSPLVHVAHGWGGVYACRACLDTSRTGGGQ